ncbi:transcription factor bHLH110-like isoform X1 [Cynara cardunculus var. scolymus]|uniref:transcription factor bHLH110-like isoform X1 n=1 Tax=Cynara cardunculus var. scolymus TaxID=59895 RepID=UPI000D625090|nr:transcription factor bHLH110-like isoform X1 [Cynara cardunculus var. scolymus]
MESANFHHHQQEEDHQILVDSSCYGLASYQNPILSMENFMAHEVQHLARIKHELCVSGSYPEISEIISSSPTSSIEDLQLQSSPSFVSKNNHQRIRYNDDHNNQDMLLKTFSNGCQIRGDHQMLMYQIPSSVESSVSYLNDTNSSYRGTFSQIFPTLNIPSLNQSPSSFDINLPALDPFGSPTFNASFSHQPSSLNGHHNIGVGLFRETCLSYGLDQMHHPQEISPAFITETTEAKRPASNYTTDAKAATPPKKSKLELRPSCAPLKIRKEKLGDRISALQQMVAPFGKTDTASVLMEAIGYIKFLQNQVETLSVPYMNSTQKANRTSSRGGSIKDVNEETKRDLRSRGLCLVPLSCLSYVTYGGGSIWATP